jgi:hypothetical protein
MWVPLSDALAGEVVLVEMDGGLDLVLVDSSGTMEVADLKVDVVVVNSLSSGQVRILRAAQACQRCGMKD